jgi:pilus assembly protein Flp/PilA
LTSDSVCTDINVLSSVRRRDTFRLHRGSFGDGTDVSGLSIC